MAKGSCAFVDRAYSEPKWFYQMRKKGLFFVTRKKRDPKFKVVEKSKADAGSGITSDQAIETVKEKVMLRQIGYYDPETYKYYIFLTNNLKLDAKVIADLYKARWQIEVFFKEIRQFLKIKKFVAINENAVKIQIYTESTCISSYLI